MIIDCISDLHGFYPKLDGGDLLIVGGDLTATDTSDEYIKFDSWITCQHYKKIIVIAGNHDNFVQNNLEHFTRLLEISPPSKSVEYLQDSGTEFEGLKIWGMPWTTTFRGMNPRCKAFTKDSETELQDKVEMIPDDVDILITHGPAHHVLDKTVNGQEVGHGHLYGYLRYAIRPKLHVFGHIHEAYGYCEHFSGCISVNASHVNERYEPVNKPIRIEIDGKSLFSKILGGLTS
jgi:Icc-related predicted phosphoesterase